MKPKAVAMHVLRKYAKKPFQRPNGNEATRTSALLSPISLYNPPNADNNLGNVPNVGVRSNFWKVGKEKWSFSVQMVTSTLLLSDPGICDQHFFNPAEGDEE